MDAEGELVDVRTLSAKIEDADLGVRDTTVKPRLWVRLEREEISTCCFQDIDIREHPGSSHPLRECSDSQCGDRGSRTHFCLRRFIAMWRGQRTLFLQ